MNKQKGITLVALVVTIIVLIILAGTSINLILGENGIITKAKWAKEVTINAQIHEQEQLNKLLDEMGESKEEVDLSTKESIWIGDSLIAGYKNNNKGFPEYYAQLTKASCLNAGYESHTISDNSPNNASIAGIVEKVLERKEEFINIDFFVLDGGYFDAILYDLEALDKSLMKDVGTIDTAITTPSTENTVTC